MMPAHQQMDAAFGAGACRRELQLLVVAALLGQLLFSCAAGYEPKP